MSAKWWLVTLVCATSFYNWHPIVLALIFLGIFCATAAGNVWCLFRGIRHHEHRSLVPLFGGVTGVLGLWIIAVNGNVSPYHLKWWQVGLPMIFDIGSPVAAMFAAILVGAAIRGRLLGQPNRNV